ncbi:hypothetical protein [Xylella taiwanensis]|uniref:hypothetical protein n=1 Tax=Xylella taiwanensis TaxID=1444770 RepID=UPI00135F1A2A|nr:hypothetical protein [Xylella taiwanensis]MCD8462263.1 hypothetical protein [Xylella taiwanensis]
MDDFENSHSAESVSGTLLYPMFWHELIQPITTLLNPGHPLKESSKTDSKVPIDHPSMTPYA